jgi:thiamine-phosphate pyrophosphorylase
MFFNLSSSRLYGILDFGYVADSEALRVAREMLEGGVDILQLRAKKFDAAKILSIATSIAPICSQFGVPFIINDHPELVNPSGADGVHVGQDDISVTEARDIVGPGKIIGLSTHSLEQATEAASQRPDYIGFGPLFATPTKPDYRPIGVVDIAAVHRLVQLPIFCIGGIKQDNLTQITKAGARHVVIVSGILQASDIAGYCRECRSLLES